MNILMGIIKFWRIKITGIMEGHHGIFMM